MDYELVKAAIRACFDSLEEETLAMLFWNGEEVSFQRGAIIYREGDALDDTFGLLLNGRLSAHVGAKQVGGLGQPQAFGGTAYLNKDHLRTATVQVESDGATILRFTLTLAEMNLPQWARLKKSLSVQAWEIFVAASQDAK
jgi:CRP-like cAMP-binding protein